LALFLDAASFESLLRSVVWSTIWLPQEIDLRCCPILPVFRRRVEVFVPEDEYESFEEAASFSAFGGGGPSPDDGMHPA
jgi:hypothetical protein